MQTTTASSKKGHLNAAGQLSQQDQIQDDGSSQQTVLTHVVHGDGVVTAHEDLAHVLVHGALAVTDIGHILDDNHMVRVLSRLVQDAVAGHHVIYHIALADLLGPEGLGSRQVHAIVVAQVVVTDNGGGLDPSAHQEVNQHALHLGLSRLEVVTSNEHVLLDCVFNQPRDKGVLGGSVDEGNALLDASHSIQAGGSNFGLIALNGRQQVLSSVVQAVHDIAVTLCVGSPQDNDLHSIAHS